MDCEVEYKKSVYRIKYRFGNKTRIIKFKPRTLERLGMDEKNYIRLNFYNYTFTSIQWSGPLINRDLALKLGLEEWN